MFRLSKSSYLISDGYAGMCIAVNGCMRRLTTTAGVLLIVGLIWGCGGTNAWDSGGGDPGGDGGGSGPGGSGGGGGGGEDDYCETGGPFVEVGDEEEVYETCSGEVAERVFTNSICSCTDVNIAGYLTTRSFDSRDDPEVIEAGAPVSVNNTYSTSGYTDVGGTFTVTGAQSTNFAGYLSVGGDLRFGGDMSAAGYLEVVRDAWLLGDVTVPGYINIHRDLHQAPGRRLMAVVTVGGERYNESFDLDLPCRCGPGDVLDIEDLVEQGRIDNDNASIGLDPAVLNNVVGVGVELELDCGRFYLEQIGGVGGITIRILGHTALFVDGDVNALGALNVEMGPEGELDLFVRGNLVTIGAGSFGSSDRPAMSRIYVGGEGDVVLIGAAEFVGNVYAPRSRITAVGAAFVYGSLFGHRIDMPGALMVHYDRHILDVGEDCGEDEDPEMCDRCDNDCPGNRACVDNVCIDCRTDSDCCEPLVCWPDGSCGPLML